MKINWKDGTYEGKVDFKKRPHGFGRYTYTGYGSGGYLEGNWVHGFLFGKGVEDHNGPRYEGEFQNSGWFGHGKFIYRDGTYYEGEFKGNKCGLGKMIYANGDLFEGEWFINKSSIPGSNPSLEYSCPCKGKLVKADGTIMEGVFTEKYNGNGELFLHGKGKEIINGMSYEGDFVNGVREGYGKLFFNGVLVYEGAFFHGMQGSAPPAPVVNHEKERAEKAKAQFGQDFSNLFDL